MLHAHIFANDKLSFVYQCKEGIISMLSEKLDVRNHLTLCILMDFPIYIDTISMGLPIVYLKGTQVDFLTYDVFLSLKIGLIIANSADPDEMQHYAAFHLGLHCQGTRLGVSSIQRVNHCMPFFQKI